MEQDEHQNIGHVNLLALELDHLLGSLSFLPRQLLNAAPRTSLIHLGVYQEQVLVHHDESHTLLSQLPQSQDVLQPCSCH